MRQLLGTNTSRVVAYGLLLAIGTAALMWAAATPISNHALLETGYLFGLGVILQRVMVNLPRGRLNLTAIATQGAAMLLPPQLTVLIAVSSTAFWAAERAPFLLRPVRILSCCLWTVLAASLHAVELERAVPIWIADLSVVIVNSASNWALIAIAISLFSGESFANVIRRNLSRAWSLAFIMFGAGSLLFAHVLRPGDALAFAYSTLVPLLAFTLRSHVVLGAITPTVEASVRQVSEQSARVAQLEGAIHDLRNVIMAANVVATDGSTDELRPILSEALDVSRRSLEGQDRSRPYRHLELRDLLRRVRAVCVPIAATRRVHLDMELPIETEPMSVFGDAVLLVELLTNLTLNAIDVSPAHTSVRVSCSVASSGERLITVRDSGKGFRTGESLEATAYASSRRGPGHGIGLRWSQGVAAQHLGHLELASSADSGSILVLRLPEPYDAERRIRALQQ